MLSVLYGVLGFLTTVFLWEHLGTTNLIRASSTPSYFLFQVGKLFSNFYRKLGELFAMLSSFVLKLRLELFAITFKNLSSSVWSIVSSPVTAVYGYMGYVRQYIAQTRREYVFIGSFILLEVVVLAIAVYLQTRAIFPFIMSLGVGSSLSIMYEQSAPPESS